jgi:uncharacterized protein (TIGR02391 family)
MAVSRPLTKELLKKLFLKTRYEIRPGGRLSDHGWSLGGVIACIPHLYPELGKSLTNEEKVLVTRAAYELERDGFLWQDIGQSESFKILSDLGTKVVQQDLAEMRLPSIDIDQLLSRDDLRGLVRDDFNSGDYETAVFKAFRHLEESARAKAKEPASSLGVTLMSAAFSPANGKLKHPGALVPQEQDGLHQLMRGAIGWFKNPSSHRTVPRDDSQKAAHVLAFANMLLDLLDECN